MLVKYDIVIVLDKSLAQKSLITKTLAQKLLSSKKFYPKSLISKILLQKLLISKNQRTNGPVNAHLRSAVYTNVIENSPSIGADEALGPFFFFFFFFRIINILSIQVFPFK